MAKPHDQLAERIRPQPRIEDAPPLPFQDEPSSPHAPSPVRQWLRKGLARGLPRSMFMVEGPIGSDGVALTFDDGPDPRYTPDLLDTLKTSGVVATFFVIGEHAIRFPELIRRIVAEGHTLGNHSWSHENPSSTSAEALVEEVRRTREVLGHLCSHRPTLFRPPHGKLTAGKMLGLWREHQNIVLWNRDPKDFAHEDAAPVARWFAQNPVAGGDIVLLHDVHPHAARVLPDLIADARRRGLRFCTPTEWLE